VKMEGQIEIESPFEGGTEVRIRLRISGGRKRKSVIIHN